VVSLSSCFSGGVFIAACMLDLLPEVEEQVQGVVSEIKSEYQVDLTEYPTAQFLVVCGFFLILFIEQTVFHFQEKCMNTVEEQEVLIDGKQDNFGSYQSLHVHIEHYDHHHHGQAEHSHDDEHHSHLAVFQQSTLRSLMLLLALSFHSVFEGIAIGLQDSSGQLVSVFVAVILHKAVMAFSLGLNIAQSNLSYKSTLVSNIIFSLASPLGVGGGMMIAGLPQNFAQDLVSGVLQGIAGGTFLYITFFEVLPHELNIAENRLLKVLSVVLGYASICFLLFFAH